MFEVGGVSLAIALAAGLLSCLSPCALPMVPTYLGYLSGATIVRSDQGVVLPVPRGFVFRHALAFVLGFSLIFIVIGVSAGLVGWILRDNLDLLGKLAGSLMILFGLHLSGVVEIPAFLRERRIFAEFERPVTYARSSFVGAGYAIGWTPCIGPTLGAILTLAAASGTAAQGGLLLFVYSLGMALPFLAIALAFTSVHGLYRRLGRYLQVMSFLSGLLLIGVGILVFTGSLVEINRYFGFGPGGLSGNL